MATDPSRFAVRVADAGPAPLTLVERLSINRAGETAIRGNATLLNGNLLQPAGQGIGFRAPQPPPQAPAPWRCYRTLVPREGKPPVDTLRLELFTPGKQGNPNQFRLAIGQTTPNPGFKPGLTLEGSGTITATGGLTVNGQIIVISDPGNPLDLGLIQVKLDVPANTSVMAPDPGPVYKVEITNPSRALVTVRRIYATLTINKQPRPPKIIETADVVLPEESLPKKDVTFPDVPQGAADPAAVLRVVVVGRGAAGNAIHAADQKTIAIGSPGPIS